MDKLGPKPTKAYKSSEFLGSREARQIRVLCEMNETESRLKSNGIEGTVLFFGSARSRTRADFEIKLKAMEEVRPTLYDHISPLLPQPNQQN